MNQALLLFVLLFGAVVTVPLGKRVHVPPPVIMTLLGAAMAAVPAIPAIDVPPDLILPLVLPPLLYAAAQRTSWHQFAVNWQPIVLLAVFLVFMTATAVAAVAMLVIPGVTVAGAVVLGAIVAPPDPVAIANLARSLHLPRRLVAILEGEGLFNDVTAIVLYKVAIVAAVTGAFSWREAAVDLALSALLAIAVGLGIGWITGRIMRVLDDASLRVGLSLLVPFLSFIVAEEVHGSGVLAVLVTALWLSSLRQNADDVEGRLMHNGFWRIVETLVTGVAFGLVGLELQTVAQAVDRPIAELIAMSAAIIAVAVGVRLFWLVPASSLVRRIRRRLNPDAEIPAGWRETVVMWWSGMRGVATAALALAIPFTVGAGDQFPAREEIIFTAFSVIMATLVLQGLTLPLVVRVLDVVGDHDAQNELERHLAATAYSAAKERIAQLAETGELPTEIVDPLRRRAADMASRIHPRFANKQRREALAEHLEKMQHFRFGQRQMMSAAREAVLAERRKRSVDPVVVDHVIHLLDIRHPR